MMSQMSFPRMKIILAAGLMLLFAPVQTSATETLEIPLDVCQNCAWDDLELAFDTGGTLIGLSEVRVRIEGVCGQIEWGCSEGFYVLGRYDAAMSATLHGGAGEPVIASGELVFTDSPRTETTREFLFDVSSPESFAAIADGHGQVVLSDPSRCTEYNTICYGYYCPFQQVCDFGSATLILVFDDLVAAEDSSWGAIKSVYR